MVYRSDFSGQSVFSLAVSESLVCLAEPVGTCGFGRTPVERFIDNCRMVEPGDPAHSHCGRFEPSFKAFSSFEVSR